MRFLDYINLRQQENSPDLAGLRDILVDTAVLPFFINPKLPFGAAPNPETLESIRLAIGAILYSKGFADRYHLSPQALEGALDTELCFQEGLRKYIHLELDAYFKQAYSADPQLLHEISPENDSRIVVVGRATNWLASAYPPGYSVIKLFNEVNIVFNKSLKEYKSSLVHH